jgi:polygalacturonase
MKKVTLNFAALIFSCSMLQSCGGKEEASANASAEATSSVNTNASTNATQSEESKIDEVKSKNNESDNKKIEGLINQYEDGVKRKASLMNNPPMNPDAAMRDLDAIDAELNGIAGKLNGMTLSNEQKTRFNSAKRKNKNS